MTDGARMVKMLSDISMFDKKQIMEALYWMALGDGHIEKPQRGDCLLSVSHIPKHEDYILWKSFIIDRIFRYSVKNQTMKSGLSGSHEMLRLRSQHHPIFTSMRDRLYSIGRKTIDPYALSLLGPIGLAILYQDDGSYHYSTQAGHNILIHKFCFSKFELEALAKTLVDKFGIIFRTNFASGKGYRLRLRAKDKDKFFTLIDPYVVPSMLYKVGRGSSQKTDEMI